MSTSTSISINAVHARDIEAAAASVAKAKAARDHVAAEHEVAAAARDEILARISEMNADRAAIVESRRAGKLTHDQGARLAALAADIEIATEVHAEREADAGKAMKAVTDAQLAVAQAEDKLRQMTVLAEYQGVLGKLREIETAFSAALARAQELHRTIAPGGSRFMYAPAPGLCNIVRRLDLGRLDHARGGMAAY